MDIAAIKARIAELEQRKAERNAMRGYRDVSYLDYMVNNDRSGFDRIDASEQAYRNMIEQQKFSDDQRQATQLFNEQQREIDRELSRELADKQREEQAKYTQNELANKYQLAMTDYELAEAQKDTQKPETLSRYKRAAQMVNHYGSQLGFEPVKPDFETDAPAIKVNKAIAKVRALRKTTPTKWTNAQKQEYVDTMALIPDNDERKAELEVALTNMPKTTNEKEYDRWLELKNKQDDGAILFGKEIVDWEKLNPKYGK